VIFSDAENIKNIDSPIKTQKKISKEKERKREREKEKAVHSIFRLVLTSLPRVRVSNKERERKRLTNQSLLMPL